jgi:translation initiation factor 2 gamma subunit (eIF-2gamma)
MKHQLGEIITLGPNRYLVTSFIPTPNLGAVGHMGQAKTTILYVLTGIPEGMTTEDLGRKFHAATVIAEEE